MSCPLLASTPPAVLGFGLLDPTGRIDIPADSVTAAAFATHALSVPCATAVTDSAGLQGLERANPDFIDEQARYLLEDMPIAALKVGMLSCPETAGVIAGVAADYSEAPLVLQLGPQENLNTSDEDEYEGVDGEPCVGAILELLVPQATIAVLPATAMARWLNDDVLRNYKPSDGASALLTLGASWALVTGHEQRPGSRVNLLLGPEGQTIALPCQPTPARVQELSSLTAMAIACNLAHGRDLIDAVKSALTYAGQAAQAAFQAGMGHKLANRMPTTTS